MDDVSNADEQLLVDHAREYARAELLDLDRKWDRGEGTVVDALPALAEMGFMNMILPEEVGGLGCSYRAYSRILHEVSYASPSAAVTLSVHNMVGYSLYHNAPADKRNGWLENWGNAKSLGAFAISEAGAGSNPAESRTRAVVKDGQWRINGEKMWITNGLTARWFVVLARTSPGEGKQGLSMMMVDGGASGISRTPIHGKMGIRGSETAVIAFDETPTPQDFLLGDEGRGLQVSLATLHGGRIGIAAQATGIAEACLDEMVAYAKEREQFGRKIGEFQAVQRMIADSATELSAARQLIHHAAGLIDAGRTDPPASSKAKLFATEAASRIADRAVQIFGGMGYVQECRVEQLYRDVRVTRIYEGTSEIQRLVIARELLR